MWARLRSLVGGSIGRSRVERDLSDELDFHLKARTDHWVGQGLPPSEAARRARLEFGSVERYKEASRHARGLRWYDEVLGDLRYGLRTLGAAKGFTFVAVAMLAIAIGANTAVFSVLDAVLFRMLPVKRPQELRELAWVEGGLQRLVDLVRRIDAAVSRRPAHRVLVLVPDVRQPPRSVDLVQRSLSLQQSDLDGRHGGPRRAGIDARRQWELRRRAGRGHIARPADLARGRPGRRAARGRAHQHRMAAALRWRSERRRSDGHDQRRVRGGRRRDAARLLRSRARVARRHARTRRSDDADHRAGPRRAQQSEELGVSRDGPRADGCRRCAGPDGNRGVDAPGPACGAPRAES